MGAAIFCSEVSILTFQRTVHLGRLQNTYKNRLGTDDLSLKNENTSKPWGEVFNQSHLDILSTWKIFLCIMSYAFSFGQGFFFFYMVAYEPYVSFAHVIVRRLKGYM